MLSFLDRWIEKKLKQSLHAQREKHIDEYLHKFVEKHPDAPTDFLRSKLEQEANRVYPLADKSILKARLLQARIGFWITALISVLVIGFAGGFTGGAAIPFLMPLAGVFVAWGVVVATIPANYNQRIKGGLNSVISLHEKFLERCEGQLPVEFEILNEGPASSARILSLIESHPNRVIYLRILPSASSHEVQDEKEAEPFEQNREQAVAASSFDTANRESAPKLLS